MHLKVAHRVRLYRVSLDNHNKEEHTQLSVPKSWGSQRGKWEREWKNEGGSVVRGGPEAIIQTELGWPS